MTIRLQIEPTDRVVELEAPSGRVPARAWQGVLEDGTNIVAFITTIAVPRDAPSEVHERFEQALQEAGPTTTVGAPHNFRIFATRDELVQKSQALLTETLRLPRLPRSGAFRLALNDLAELLNRRRRDGHDA